MSDAFIGGWTLKRGDGGGPEVFTTIPECFEISEVGKTNSLVDVTSFDSAGEREYKSGLADGSEISVQANLVLASTQQIALQTDVTNKVTRNFQLAVTDATTTKTLSFAATCLAWVYGPSVDGRNTISYTLKISGAITIA